MKKIFAFAMLAAAVVPAHAVMLWNQYDYDNTAGGPNPAIADQEFSDFPTFNGYVVGDVTVGAGGWNVSEISELFNNPAGGVALWTTGVTQARLNIFAKTGALPTAANDPTAGSTVAVTCSVFAGDAMEIKASGLSIGMAAGSYWVGLAPLTTFGTHGQAFHYQTFAQIGDLSAFRNPGGGFGIGTGWGHFDMLGQNIGNGDSTLRIQGTIAPEPASLAALGLGAIALFRRRNRK